MPNGDGAPSGSNTIRILVEGAVGGGEGGGRGEGGGAGEAGGGAAGGVGGESTRTRRKANDTFNVLRKFAPVLGGAFGIYEVIKHSKIISSTTSMMFELFSAIVDVLLMPFMPFIAEIAKIMVKFIPLIMKITQPLGELIRHILELKVIGKSILYAVMGVTAAIVASKLLNMFGMAGLGGMAGSKLGMLGLLGKIGIGAAGAGIAAEGVMGKNDLGSWAKTIGGGAAAGAMIGSVIPGVGTLIGAGIGLGIAGAMKGIFGKQMGAGFIPATGLYQLHRGEQVLSSARVGTESPVTVNNSFNINMNATADVDVLIRKIQQGVNMSLETSLRRTR